MKHQGTWGDGAYILKTGQMLAPQVQSSNEIRIRDGALMVQGALGCVKVNTYDPVTIQNGTQGMKRIDLICWQYTYDAEQDIESAEWVVVQGTPAESDPQTPTYTEGNIQEGDALVQIPVFAVHLDGINITGVDTLLEIAPDISTINASLSYLIGNKIDKYNINVSNEVLTGETFAGRPVYMRLVDIGVLPNNTSKTINTGITNAYYFWIDPTYSMAISGGAGYPLPYVDPANVANSIGVRIIANGKQVVITTHSNWSTYAGFVAVRHTKM